MRRRTGTTIPYGLAFDTRLTSGFEPKQIGFGAEPPRLVVR